MSVASQEFLRSAAMKSADLTHRQLICRAIDSYNVAAERGRTRFFDWEAARLKCQEIKWEAVNNLDRYLLEFEQRVKDRGGHVYWAENSEEACRYIADLAVNRGVHKIVKSKSMVSEEIHLTPALEKLGIKVVETDLGEYIVQLREETPYHIVTPAMHLTRKDIAALFKEKLGGIDTDDPQQLVAVARRTLRRDFFSAEMGISGANFLVADAGMIALTTNEGNARLSTSLPRIHVVLSGIEKVIPRLQDLAVLWPVLATAGTGQPITCYSTLAGGPRQANEPDGPDEFHVVLVDNGRSELLANVDQREVLHCIRCGACINACPIFRTIGGHSYGTTYMGPIGSVLTPHLQGLSEYQHMSYASSLCGACADVCPVNIDLPRHLLHNRHDAVNAADRPWIERMTFAFWRWIVQDAKSFALVGWVARLGMRVMRALRLEGTALDPARKWNRNHAPLPIAEKSFRALWGKRNGAS